MEIYREDSSSGKNQVLVAGTAFVALLSWMAYEIWHYMHGGGGLGLILYVVAFIGLFIWRCGFRYTYILNTNEIIVVTSGLGLRREFIVDLSYVESFANKYQKQFFKGTGIKRYIYRYSSLDPHPVRILVFNRKGQLQGLLFKVSEEFLGKLQELLPDRMLDLENDRRKTR